VLVGCFVTGFVVRPSLEEHVQLAPFMDYRLNKEEEGNTP
jgi:hypothetical protein